MQEAEMPENITDLDVSLNEADESGLLERGFSKINVDLNNGAGANHIYLWYKTGQNAPITRIQFSFNYEMTKGLTEEGYLKIDKDLNAGTDGNHIYLWFYRGSSEYDINIVDLHITTNAKGEVQMFRDGWERQAFDLNRKAKGNATHLWVKREKQTYICDITATDCFETDTNNFHDGYIRVDKETNRGAGGRQVFIWYRQTADAKTVLKDLQISMNDDDYQNYQSQQYQLVNVNLSEGTGGTPAYLWYKKNYPDNPITAISVITNKEVVQSLGEVGVQVIKKNLNNGNIDAVVFLCYCRE